MLNDIAWPTRLLVLGFGLAVGVMVGGPVSDAGSGVGFALLMGGIGLELAIVFSWAALLGVAERSFRRAVVTATADISAGTVRPVPAIGRVVRRRPARHAWYLPGRGAGPGPSDLTVLTAVGDGAPRRVAALVPRDLGLSSRGAPAALLVHPHRRDVAVVEDRVTAAQVAGIGADPRWGTERLPSDRTVVGGYLALLASLAVGVGAGVGLSAMVVALAT